MQALQLLFQVKIHHILIILKKLLEMLEKILFILLVIQEIILHYKEMQEMIALTLTFPLLLTLLQRAEVMMINSL